MFKFFKKKGLKEKSAVSLEELSFSEARKFLDRKIDECKIEEALALTEVRERIKGFGLEIHEKVVVLEDFDVESIRDDGRIKSAVREARKLYVGFLRVLIRDLKKVDSLGLKLFVHEVNGILSDFSKKSFRNYERTTFLIGDEMAAIKNSLKDFSGDVLRIFDDDKSVVDSLDKFDSVKENMDLLVFRDDILNGADKAILGFDNEIDNKKKEKVDLNRGLEELRVSSEYLGYLKDRKELESLEKSLRGDVLSLKQVVDIKGLANFFHSDSRKMNVVKRYKDYFVENFEKDDGEELVDILGEAGVSADLVLGKIEGIRGKKIDVERVKGNVGDDKSLDILNRIGGVEIEILKLGEDKIIEGKKVEKLKEGRADLFEDVEAELKELGILVVR